SYNSLQDIVQSDHTLQTAIFINNKAGMLFGFLELFHYLVSSNVFGHKKRRLYDVFKPGEIIYNIKILDRYHTFDIINGSFTNGINRMRFLYNFVSYLFFVIIHIKPGNITSMGHQGSDVTIAQVKDPFY